MNAKELAQAISVALEHDVQIDTHPKIKGGAAFLECEDEEGNVFSIRVVQTNVVEDDEDEEVFTPAPLDLDDISEEL